MEHAFLNSINAYLEEAHASPHTMIGFRAHLFTQDAMLQLKEQILDNRTRDTKAILGLDLEKAFNNVAHSAIVDQISNLNLGVRACIYGRDFLADRKATLSPDT